MNARNKTAVLSRILFLAAVSAASLLLLPGAALCVTATDYSNYANWLNIPASTAHEVDVVYFYPTAYSPSGPDAPTVGTIDDEGMRAGARDSYEKQATAFETCANIYAPFYRQVDAMTLAGMTQDEMIEAESGEPKTDVFAALDYYFENWNDGRPFMLAGHSQGAMMIYIALADYMKRHPDRYARMVAAYMIGNAPTEAWLAKNAHVKLAAGADDTGVVVSWNTEGPGNLGKYNMVVPEGARCINPLNWRTDGTYAGVELNKGCLVQNSETGEYEVVPGFADAQIETSRGSVICTSVDSERYAIPAAMQSLFGPESYHGWDFGFYYMNIRENAANRAKRFLADRNTASGSSSGCDAGGVPVMMAALVFVRALAKILA